MKVLIVSRGHPVHPVSPFVRDQAQSLADLGVKVELLPLSGKGVWPYLSHPLALRKRLSAKDIDIVHAYYVFSAMTTMFQCKVPVVTSFIGGDIVIPWQRWISLATVCRTASKCLFVNRDMRRLAKMEDRGEVLPFGTDMQRFFPTNLDAARQRLGLNPGKRYILFSSTFDRVEKNLCLARQALELLSGQNIELLEFKLNFAEYELNDYFNACDLLLLTSHFEGSPQVVKEAMASCRPIVSTRVGDVEWLLGDTDGTYLSDHSPRSVADNIQQALDFQGPTRGRERLVDLGLDLGSVAKRLVSIYESVLSA